MNDNDLYDVRKQLVTLGYKIIPNKGKVPVVNGYNTPAFIAHELTDGYRGKTALERVHSWGDRFDAPSTGVLIRDGLGVVDIDVDDPMVDRLIEEIGTIAPEVIKRAPTRYGGGTYKMALFVRIEGDRFKRHGSAKYNGHHVEIFGSALNGDKCVRQFGIYGPHSFDANGKVVAEYLWDENTAKLWETPSEKLPPLTEAQAFDIITEFENLANDLGWIREKRPACEQAGPVYDIDDSTRFDTDKGDYSISYQELCEQQAIYGELRCSSSFMGGEGHRKDRCWVFMSPRHNCVAVFVYGDEITHYPKSMAKPGNDLVEERLQQVKQALEGKKPELPPDIGVNDFYAFMPKHAYLFAPNGDLWPGASINSRLPRIPLINKDGTPSRDKDNNPRFMKPSVWLDKNRAVEQMSWAPGEPQIIVGQLATEGGWITRPGVATFNLYQPPMVVASDGDATRWILLVRTIYPEHWEHIVRFCAHRIQRPAEKINHALVLTGSPGIGKDTLLEPLKYGVGACNFREVSPHNIVDKHNDFVRSVCLRISEARDLGDVNRYALYETMKTLTAAPPDMLRIDVKYIPQYYVPNVTAVIVTTNYPADGLFLPADDRRHYVCGTEINKDEFTEPFWREMWAWYAAGGLNDIVGYLRNYDLSAFDAKRPPEKTAAFWRMVDTGQPAEVPEMSDALECAGSPDAVTVSMVAAHASHELRSWLGEVKNRRTIPHRFESCGYIPIRSSSTKDGYWVVGNKRQVVYCKKQLSGPERYKAAETLAANGAVDSASKNAGQSGNVTPILPFFNR